MPNTLSIRAQSFLKESKRLYEPESRSAIEEKLVDWRIEPNPILIDFEYNFGGYVLEGRDQWTLKLMFDNTFLLNNILFIECALHRTAQFTFHLDEMGIIYATQDESAFPLASSIQLFVEREALYNELKTKNFFYRLDAEAELEIAQLSSFKRMNEVSDSYESWLVSEDDNVFIAKTRTWDDESRPRVIVFSHNQEKLRSFIEELERSSVLYSIRKWA